MMIGKQANNKRLQAARLYLRSREGGFTIIESLVAILVVAILLVAIAPVLSLSVATRVQSKRIELATQAAKSYIDGVKTKKILAPSGPTTATTLTATTAPTATGTLTCTTTSTPTGVTPVESKFCSDTTLPTGALYCVDFDGSGTCENTSVTDMVVQGFRPSNSTSTAGYALGVRVYRADAFALSSTTLSRNNASGNNEKVTQATFTGGAGQRKAPLVEMTTDINDTVPKYSDLCTRYGGCN